MYRNTYLELYKTSITTTEQTNLTLLLAHFSQIYNTLGCVLQDLQFQIGKVMIQPQTPHNQLKEQFEQYKKMNQNKHKQDKEDTIKVEQSSLQNQHYNQHSRTIVPNKQRAYKNQRAQEAREPKQQQLFDPSLNCSLMERLMNQTGQKSKKAQPMEMDHPVIQIPRSIKGNDSFDSLFETNKRKNSNQNMEIEHKSRKNKDLPMESIPQAEQQHSQPASHAVENTYEDFLERIFKEGESRKSK